MSPLDFWHALGEQTFLRYALYAGLLAAVACGVVGSYVVARRITYIAGGIAHCVLGGMGAARYLQVVHHYDWLQPLHGAVFAALVAALLIGWVSLRWREREDTVISALWAIGMAIGVLFIWGTPGYNENLMSYLFGNILMVTPGDLWLVGILDALVVVVSVLLYEQLLAVCFDEEFARLRGLPVELLYLLLLCLTALTVVLLVTVVGLVMVIALLSLPVAMAGLLSRSLWHVMILAAFLSALLCAGGLAVSYVWNFPTGATTILLTGAAYLMAMGAAGIAGRVRDKKAPRL